MTVIKVNGDTIVGSIYVTIGPSRVRCLRAFDEFDELLPVYKAIGFIDPDA
jgi:hypothetical protein